MSTTAAVSCLLPALSHREAKVRSGTAVLKLLDAWSNMRVHAVPPSVQPALTDNTPNDSIPSASVTAMASSCISERESDTRSLEGVGSREA
ncbi:hypothetical protein BDV40DRAFT_302611 [Aspergillus tamarii]|uniref:Uncharacterized protein n=1 Tax=Aspergillus tamarii TaxID=41984 RepID=A0A5N6UN57_ASPTM|nr:hypothetical protein BDV40DRAFT_302611 [Aspergillus tamarii]